MKLTVLVVLASMLAVPAGAHADQCKSCDRWEAAWTGQFVNIEWAGEPGRNDDEVHPAGWLVSGIWFRVNNRASSRDVTVCFGWRISDKDGDIALFDRNTHEWGEWAGKRRGFYKVKVTGDRCLTAKAHELSDAQFLTTGTRPTDRIDDLTVLVQDVSVQFAGSPPSSPASPVKSPSTSSKPTATKRIKSYAQSRKLARELKLREQAIHNALYLDRARCEPKRDLLSEPEVLSLCNDKRAGNVHIELYDHPEEVEGSADDDPSVSYRVQVGCRVVCSCEDMTCAAPEPKYLGLAGDPGPQPDFNAVTVNSDIHHYFDNDLSNGRSAITYNTCLQQIPTRAEVAKAFKDRTTRHKTLDDGTDTVIMKSSSMRFLGETSGAILTFKCDLLCTSETTHGKNFCLAYVTPPLDDAGTITAADLKSSTEIARARPIMVKAARTNQLPPSEHITYLAPEAKQRVIKGPAPDAPPSPAATPAPPATPSSGVSYDAACFDACTQQNDSCFDQCNYNHPVGDSDTSAVNRERHHYKDCDENDGDSSCETDNADRASDEMEQLHLCLQQCNATRSSCVARCR